MVIVDNVRDFAIQNEKDLRKFMQYKTGIHDKDIIDDTIQEFYVRLIESRALERFDEDRCLGSKKKGFETFICNLFCWMLPVMARKNFRVRFEVVSRVKERTRYCNRETDVWDYMGPASTYRADKGYEAAHLRSPSFEEDKVYLDEFVGYLESSVKSPKKRERMKIYLSNISAGCTGSQVACVLSVSNAMVSMLKADIRDRYEEWKNRQCHYN